MDFPFASSSAALTILHRPSPSGADRKFSEFSLWRTKLPHDVGLPQTSDAQDTGEDARTCFWANKPKNFRPQELSGDSDFGFDFQIQIIASQQVVHAFRLQLKGTRSPQLSADETFLSIGLSTSTLRLYDNTDEPVLLVLCDLSIAPEDPRDCPLYFVWVREELERIGIASIPQYQQTAVLRVPTSNRLTRATDLLSEFREQFRLSRSGHVLEAGVADLAPSLATEDRIAMVEAVSRNLPTHGLTLMTAISEPASDVWVNPPPGSLAWLLTEARQAIGSGRVDKCQKLLQAAEKKLAEASTLERAEYWNLIGKMKLALGDDVEAVVALREAAKIEPLPRYVAAWAEGELVVRYHPAGGADLSDVLLALPTSGAPVLLAIRARVLAAQHQFAQAIALLDTFDGVESFSARAVVETMQSRHEEALQACIDGIALAEHEGASTTLLLKILRARARFNIALRPTGALDVPDNAEPLELPPSGPVGVDSEALHLAWRDIEDVVDAMEETRWVSNAEFVVDMWVATAAMLGKQRQIVDQVIAVAASRPHQAEVQLAAEMIAARCGNLEEALKANARLPESDTKVLHRLVFLHMLEKHRDCVTLMGEKCYGIDRTHHLFASALVAAAMSADVLARQDLVEEWGGLLLQGNQIHEAYAAVLHYTLAKRGMKFDRLAALSTLTEQDERLGNPAPTSTLLFQELDPSLESEAKQFLATVSRMRLAQRLSPALAVWTGVALATLERWQDLLSLCEEAAREFDVPQRVRAFHGLALDHLGRSDEAIKHFEQMLELGTDDELALGTYVNIFIRWGDKAKVKSGVEAILERAQTRERKMACVRTLFSLEQQVDPQSSRLLDLALRMGELVRQDQEVEESTFVSMFLTATSFSEAKIPSSLETDLQQRVNSFFERFPKSKSIQSVVLSKEATAEELMSTLRAAVGITEELEHSQKELEEKLRTGRVHVPFAWRPRLALANVQDVADLWALSKVARAEENHLHFAMILGEWTPLGLEDMRSKVPLFDLLTLFVLKDLDLLDALFSFFPKIAIGQEALSELSRLAQPLMGSIASGACLDLQESLRVYMGQIAQPQITPKNQDPRIPLVAREMEALLSTNQFTLFSDDAVFRLWLLKDRPGAYRICTLDLLHVLEESGNLSTVDVAQRISKLCLWNVVILVQLKHIAALVSNTVRSAADAKSAASLLREDASFMAVADGIWAPRSDYAASLGHIGAVVRELSADLSMPEIGTAAVVLIWLDKARERETLKTPEIDRACQLVLFAILPGELPLEATKRLWGVFFKVIESLNSSLDRDAASARLGIGAKSVDDRHIKEAAALSPPIGDRLLLGLEADSPSWKAFQAGYGYFCPRS